MTIEQRLAKLEQQNRWMRRAGTVRTLLLFVAAAVLIAGCCHTPHTDKLSKRLSTAKTREDLKSYCPKEGGRPNTALITYYINVEVEKSWWKRVGEDMDWLKGSGEGGLYLAVLILPFVMGVEALSDNKVIVHKPYTITVTFDADGNIVRYDKPRAQPSPPERFKRQKTFVGATPGRSRGPLRLGQQVRQFDEGVRVMAIDSSSLKAD